jgi:hypothetical protein
MCVFLLEGILLYGYGVSLIEGLFCVMYGKGEWLVVCFVVVVGID